MDRLEEHIRKNREDLDRYDAKPEIWNKIDNTLRKKRIPITGRRLAAASVILLIGISTFFYFSGNDESNADIVSSLDEIIMKSNPNLQETEMYYNTLIKSLYQEATPLLTKHPEIEKEMITDITQLDRIRADIKEDLKDNIANQDVVEALIQNYRLKIRLLEEMLTLLKDTETDQKKNINYEL
jgi:hypothetical protein